MEGQSRRFGRARSGISIAAATIVVVIVISASVVGIVEIQATSGSGAAGKAQTTFTTTISLQPSTVTVTQITTVTVTPIQQELAQVAVIGTALPAAGFLTGGSTKTFACATSSSFSYLTVVNTGAVPVAVATISITWAGSNTAYTLLGSCNIGPAGSATSTTYIQFPATSTITPSANTGKAFAGTVTLTNGAQLPFAGFWQGGSVQIAVTGTAFLASYFLTGGSTKNFFCATTSSGSYLTLTNTGTSSASVGAISVTWAGSNTVYTGPNNCNIGAAGSSTATTYLLFPATNTITPSAISGQAFTGTVTLSDGEQLLFTGTWQ